MGDTGFLKSIRYRYDTNDFWWYRYQISMPIPVSLNRQYSFIVTEYCCQNAWFWTTVQNSIWNTIDDLPSANSIKHTFRKKIRIFQLFLRFD